MKKILFLIAFLGIISLNSCKTSSVMRTSDVKYEQTDSNSIEIFLSKKPNKEYDEIGRVSADKYSNMAIKRAENKIQQALKEKAASIGGNAIINVTEDIGSISGIVIRYK
ncbi:hypothetical protein P700755_003720 [Psychroflexus torquis ATCC 700755]|jgi:hypothetical protein|uniref:Uncharacterized protein n=1 Tax=Psychroflexus torquis (strain ATCC 700755 / CIP 106069 / ACAM 623) TaxID=313595 RepID=K4IKG8_PSYTT|nr:hypothetical protein [Psychroflexus torquis]AFU70308.1 hypothetical protein P700755_003720 [Psychroflexus torquis ATCC 700755]